VVVVPVGATEQHGPHLPVATDWWHVEWVARRAAAAVNAGGSAPVHVVVAPTLPFGSSPHHLPFGATISLPTTTYYEVLVAILESLVTDGFRRLFLVNGHGGNHELIQIAARDVALRHPVVVAAGSWWNIAWDVLVEAGAGDVGRLPGHAGGFETSLVMSMRPDVPLGDLPAARPRDTAATADPRRFSPLVRTEVHDFWPSIEGFSDGPVRASRDAGERFLEVSVAEVARRIEALAGSPLPG
jgi:creatinine amidohydrolase